MNGSSDPDILVAGAGPAGICAAIAAARAGARVALVERNALVGGCAIIGLALHTFHTREGRQVVRGLPGRSCSGCRRGTAPSAPSKSAGRTCVLRRPSIMSS